MGDITLLHKIRLRDLIFIGVGGGGGGQGGTVPQKNWKPEIRAKCGKNSGKMREEFRQNSGENSGKKWRKKRKETTAKKKSGKFTGREWNINCIFKSIKLFENNSQELSRFYA